MCSLGGCVTLHGMQRPGAITVTALAVAALVFAAPAAASESPGHFAARVATYRVHGQWATWWQSFYPPQRRAGHITRAEFLNCSRFWAVYPRARFRVHTVAPNTPQRIPGLPGRYRTVEVNLWSNLPAFTPSLLHVLRYGGAWKWYLSRNWYASFADGECPT
jgi:hypothetical protein